MQLAAPRTGHLVALALRSLRFPLTGLAAAVASIAPELDAERVAAYLVDVDTVDLLAAGGPTGADTDAAEDAAAARAAAARPGEVVPGTPPHGLARVAAIATLLPDGTACVLVAESRQPVDGGALYDASGAVSLLAQLVVQQRAIAALEREVRHRAQDRSLLIASLHHDLRAPLTSIVGSAQTVRARWDVLTPSQREELLDCVERQADRLHQMVSDNLRADASSPHGPPRLRLVDLGRLCRRAAAVAELSRSGEVVVEDPGVTVTTDDERLERALLNLLDNALKYSPPGVPVHLILEQHGDGGIVTVADKGPGVDDAVLPRLFGAYSTDPGRTDGTGLGLHSARALLDAVGGRITYARHSGWSRFAVTLPSHEIPRPRTEAGR